MVLLLKSCKFIGSVYIYYSFDAGITWSGVQKLVAFDSIAHDWFGTSVSVFGDMVAVGSPQNDEKGINAGIC